MPVDPHLQFILQLAKLAPRPKTVEEVRRFAIQTARRMPRRRIRVAGTRDMTVPGATDWLPARLYTPEGHGPFPLTVFFHGGGFAAYNLDTHDQMCRELCAGARSMVLSVHYRLAPEFPFPAGIDDAYAALCWAAGHAPELGAHRGRLAVAGDSSGGALAVAATLRAREAGPRLDAQLLLYPPTDMAGAHNYVSHEKNGAGYVLTIELMQLFRQLYFADRSHTLHPEASPLSSAQLHGFPPTLLVTAEYDPMCDEGEAFVEALVKAGSRAELLPGPGMIHGFANMTALSPAAARIADRAYAWLGQLLNGDAPAEPAQPEARSPVV